MTATTVAAQPQVHHLQTLNVIVAALGGQGGGVLLDWIAGAARDSGWTVQATSVPGVAQRTGATIYYLEIFPADRQELGSEAPVMSLFPMAANVDLVVASEVVEAGRMVQRGFVTPDRTTLVTSDHRVYAIGERAAVDNAVIDAQALRDIAQDRAKKLCMFDMQALAEQHGTVISATLLGAVAGSRALPIPREAFEKQIRASGIAIAANLRAFEAAAAVAGAGPVQSFQPDGPVETSFILPPATTEGGQEILRRLAALPAPCQEIAYQGAKKLADYLDFEYAHEYLDRVNHFVKLDSAEHAYALSRAVATQLALWSSFEDIIRVAHLKIKQSRTRNLRNEVQAKEDQIVEVRDFFKPRVEEICGIMPAAIGRAMLASPRTKGFLRLFTSGKRLSSTNIGVFLLLRAMASLRRVRRGTLAHRMEQQRITTWLAAVEASSADYGKALALAECASLVKGYGQTRERGYEQVNRILTAHTAFSEIDIRALVAAAGEDDESRAFNAQLAERSVT